jgi:hypothetical protein
VLVVVEDRDLQLVTQPALDLEAPRRRDVLKIDSTEGRLIALTKRTISSTSVVLRHRGNASTPANSLNNCALPSITGIAADGPMSPNPSTAVPSETTATVLPLIVSRILVDRRGDAGDAGRVGHR